MIKNILILILVIFCGVTFYIFKNSEKTFEAVFKHVDGLPKGAPVTALGVKVGEVVRSKPIKNGILVKIRITRKDFSLPHPGSQLSITSFRPGQGRVIEVIPPKNREEETRAWIINEPITAETWLYASIEILDGLKSASQSILKHVTPENFDKARIVLKNTSETLDVTKDHLTVYQDRLVSLENNLSKKAEEGNLLFQDLKSKTNSLKRNLDIKTASGEVNNDFSTFSNKVQLISENILKTDFLSKFNDFKINVINSLDEVNDSLVEDGQKVTNKEFKDKFKSINQRLVSANSHLEKIDKSKIQGLKVNASKTRETLTKIESSTRN